MNQQDNGAKDPIADLIKQAGERASAPIDMQKRVEMAVQQSWKKSVSQRKRTRIAKYAVAASIFLVVTVFLVGRNHIPPEPWIAKVDRIIDDHDTIRINSSPINGRTNLDAGDFIQTGRANRLGIQLASGVHVRVNGNSQLTIGSASELTLIEGRIYIDTGMNSHTQHLITIHTEFGSITDIGTQFEVSHGGDALVISVRSGQINLNRDEHTVEAFEEDSLRITGDGNVSKSRRGATDSSWHWIYAVSPGFEGQSNNLRSYLDWIAHETGVTLNFADRESQEIASRTTLSGPLAMISPDKALSAVLATTSLEYTLEMDVVTIRYRPR